MNKIDDLRRTARELPRDSSEIPEGLAEGLLTDRSETPNLPDPDLDEERLPDPQANRTDSDEAVRATDDAEEVPVPLTPTPQTEDVGWVVGTWGGMPNYLCRYCPFSTVAGVEAIRQHVKDQHTPDPADLAERARNAGLILP